MTRRGKNDILKISLGYYNPYRYRSYYYDVETKLYYLQSRYYDPEIGRFINVDAAEFALLPINIQNHNLFAYCWNNPISNSDYTGFWAETYSGFSWTTVGFNLNVQLSFLSRSFCMSYATDIIKQKGRWYWWGKGYKNMSTVRIAQELWFHALVYYVGYPMKLILNVFGVSWSWLNSKIDSAKYMQINNNDSRAWVFSLVWSAAYNIKPLILYYKGRNYPYSYIKI